MIQTTLFSVLHATYLRPQKAIEAMGRWFEKASYPDLLEYVFALNSDDPTAHEVVNSAVVQRYRGRNIHIIQDLFSGSAPAWDAAAKKSHSPLLIQGQDDIEPPDKWDVSLMEKLMARGANWPGHSIVVAVSDGYRTDGLICTAIMTRERMKQEGHFICPAYLSVFSDDDVTYRAIKHSREGTCELIDARDLVFRHRHHYHDKTVPFDETYAKENSNEAYAQGAKVFFARNPEAHTDGIRSWA